MLRLRLVFGTAIALLALSMLGVDGFLSAGRIELPAARPNASDGLRTWFVVGALSTLLALAFALAAARELIRMARAAECRPLIGVTYLFAAAFVVGPYVAVHLDSAGPARDDAWSMSLLVLAVAASFVAQAVRSRSRQALPNIAGTLFIIIYAGGLTGFLVRLRMDIGGPSGILLVLLTIFTLKMNDIGAFFVGRRFGRRKMIEWLSPKKTWEGFAGGIAAAVAFALAAGSILRMYGTPVGGPLRLVEFGLIMGIASVMGDLCASLLKRDAAVKDSGTMVPGMGGALDVLDSLLFGAPLAWFFWTRWVAA